MTTPYQSGPHVLTVDADAGPEECVEIRVPHRGMIKAIKFDYIGGGGGDSDCNFEIYTSRLACSPVGESESLSEAEEGERSGYSIFGEKAYTVVGKPFVENDKSYTFRNVDGTFSVPERKLYVAVRSAGTGVQQWSLTLEMQTSLLS